MTIIKLKILLFLFFVVPLFSIGSNSFLINSNLLVNNFDSTNCKEYQFFKTKGITFDSTSNMKLYNEVFGWFGVPYRYGGKSKAGTDCSGFASQIYKIVYNLNIGGSAGDIYRKLKTVVKSNLKEGDLVFFKINHNRISHVGVYLSNNKFIHATSYGKSVTISDLNEPYYKRYYFSAARFNNCNISGLK